MLQEFGIREEHIFTGGMTGSPMPRPGWNELMTPVQPNDTVVTVQRTFNLPGTRGINGRRRDWRKTTCTRQHCLVAAPFRQCGFPQWEARPTACPTPLDDALGGDFLPAVQARRGGSAGTAPLADQALQEHQVPAGVLSGMEGGLSHGAGGVVDGDEQRQLWSSVLQPGCRLPSICTSIPSWCKCLRRNRCCWDRRRREAGACVS